MLLLLLLHCTMTILPFGRVPAFYLDHSLGMLILTSPPSDDSTSDPGSERHAPLLQPGTLSSKKCQHRYQSSLRSQGCHLPNIFWKICSQMPSQDAPYRVGGIHASRCKDQSPTRQELLPWKLPYFVARHEEFHSYLGNQMSSRVVA